MVVVAVIAIVVEEVEVIVVAKIYKKLSIKKRNPGGLTINHCGCG